MPSVPFYQVDAFSGRPFGGNPAAVCVLEAFPDDATMAAIAAENNLSETAFLVRQGEDYALRWFTPTVEVDLCGHATLASGLVVTGELEPGRARVRFHTRSGVLEVERRGDELSLDLPARAPAPAAPPAGLEEALGAAPAATLRARDVVAVFERAEQVRALRPDSRAIAALEDTFAVCVTAPGTGDDADVDFVSRFFAPARGVPEDPVTGSAHCSLVPYWATRLGRVELRARQVSARGGELTTALRGERVELRGRAVVVVRGTMAW
ncbi:MAG TPA: PhzF family phenazine biosynthesis protein [Polyangiaceae bacterium]|nr:PhzF family phenazine biosynthesis protein [Polyangiaceae bacterium]